MQDATSLILALPGTALNAKALTVTERHSVSLTLKYSRFDIQVRPTTFENLPSSKSAVFTRLYCTEPP